MKTTLLIAAVCLGLISSISAQDAKRMTPVKPAPSALEANVRKAWEQFKTKDKVGFAAGLAEGYRSVEDDGDGARDAKAEVAEIDDFELAQYSLKNFKITPLGTGSALVTYSAEYSGTAGGQPVHDKIAVAEIWVKHGTDWKELYSQDTKVK
jgi:hypothetical protein